MCSDIREVNILKFIICLLLIPIFTQKRKDDGFNWLVWGPSLPSYTICSH